LSTLFSSLLSLLTIATAISSDSSSKTLSLSRRRFPFLSSSPSLPPSSLSKSPFPLPSPVQKFPHHPPPILHPQIYPSPASAPSPIQTLNPSAMDGSKSENPKAADVNQASDSSSFSLSSGKKARIAVEVVAAICAR
ncbi:hypothetical protein LINGRAHAP2_LOCUS12019, partial [Linum grandiflorum]